MPVDYWKLCARFVAAGMAFAAALWAFWHAMHIH